MKLTDLAERRAQHAIAFGDPKSGKTQLVAQLASRFKLNWFSIDNGHDVLFKLPAAWQDNINIIVLPDTKDYPIAIETCLKIITGARVKICDAHGKVACMLCTKENKSVTEICLAEQPLDTIAVFDHVSQLADSAMNHITKNQKEGDMYKPTWEDFRVQGQLMSKFLTNIQQSNYHVCCIAHCTETEMEDGKKKIVPLVGTVPFSRNVGKYFDHMVHFDVRNGKHAFGSSTTYIPNIVSGSRTDVAIERMMAADGKTPAPSLVPFFDGSVPKQMIVQTTAAENALSSLAAGVKK